MTNKTSVILHNSYKLCVKLITKGEGVKNVNDLNCPNLSPIFSFWRWNFHDQNCTVLTEFLTRSQLENMKFSEHKSDRLDKFFPQKPISQLIEDDIKPNWGSGSQNPE